MKAKFIGKYYGTGFDRDFVFLEYEYRNRRYEVYENRVKGNEPLRWQHANAQAKIDQEIELEERRKRNKTKTQHMTFEESLDYLESFYK